MDEELEEDSPLAAGAQGLGGMAGLENPEGFSYGGEDVEGSEYQIRTPSPEEPYLMQTGRIGVFGDTKNPVAFKYGGASTLPDGNVSPENFARVKESLVRSGTLQIGQAFRVLNPATKKMVPVIVRDVKPDNEPGPAIDVAPHVALELGGIQNIIFDPRPPKGYPVAQYSSPYVAPDEAVPASAPVEPQEEGLGGVTISGAPMAESGALRNASAVDSPEAAGPAKAEQVTKNKDGSVTFPDGETWYRDGTKSVTRGDRTYFYKEDEKTGEWELFDKVSSAKDEDKPIIVGKRPYRMNEKGELVEIPMKSSGGGKDTDKAALYAVEKATRVLQSVGELEGRVNNWTVGAGGVLLNKIPATDARDFKAELDTLKANIAFGELTEMRNASKTGGALGQVSNIELALLESTLGALDIGQSPANLKRQLVKIRGSIERWNAAKAGAVVGENKPIDTVKADAIRESARLGKITRDEAIKQLRELGLK